MTIRRMWIGTLAAIALAATGCTQTDSGEDTAALSADHEMHGRPGPDLLLQAALHHLDLTAEQRAAIESAARAIGPGAGIDHAMLAEVAAGVRAGRLDEAKLLATLDAASPRADRTAALAQALDTLHATLTADQRRALVDQIAKHMEEHAQAHGAKRAGADPMVEHLLTGLELTSDQRASIDAIVANAAKESDQSHSSSMEAVHADLAARLQSFESDRFDAGAFAGAVAASPIDLHAHVQRALHVLGAVLPVLTPVQREALAARIEAMPMHEMPMHEMPMHEH